MQNILAVEELRCSWGVKNHGSASPSAVKMFPRRMRWASPTGLADILPAAPGTGLGPVTLAISNPLNQSSMATSPAFGCQTSPDSHFCCLPSLKESTPFPGMRSHTLQVRIPFLALLGGLTETLLFHRYKLDSSGPRNIEAPELYLRAVL